MTQGHTTHAEIGELIDAQDRAHDFAAGAA
jgi:hypothetical protein